MVEESDEEEISQLFQDVGFSSHKIVIISKNSEKTYKRMQIMVKMIEMKLWCDK
uniref:Uncharacterized protein n=1 Tax=Marseillevirus LCMAC101 TaxID=2506602 RepID=A0A481YSW2_9VIRU|nr:MAG: hypothetical protein LCMAC101_01710 [Marseillevirus LCMAC101]